MDIEHKQRDGIHVFTSHDIKGLYVASRSLRRILAELPTIIDELTKLNNKAGCGT